VLGDTVSRITVVVGAIAEALSTVVVGAIVAALITVVAGANPEARNIVVDVGATTTGLTIATGAM
jgi:hypothetical protein